MCIVSQTGLLFPLRLSACLHVRLAWIWWRPGFFFPDEDNVQLNGKEKQSSHFDHVYYAFDLKQPGFFVI